MTDSEEYDVVVVGGGGSGLAAAVEAASAGKSVLVLEKCSELGGTTGRWSVGSITAANTKIQRKAGVADSTEEFYEDLLLFAKDLAGRDNPKLRRLLAEQSGDAVEWLMGLGVEFFGPFPEPPHRHPRMHNVLPNSQAYSYHLARAARKNGAVIRTGFRAKSLIVSQNRITGVVANDGSNDIEFVARQGVILAAGDYGSSKELKRAYLGDDVADIEGPNPSSTGDGHRMATELGAVVVNSDLALGPEVRFVAPPRKLLISLLPPVRAVAKLMKLGTRFAPAALIRRVMMQFLTTNLAPGATFCNEGGILVKTDGRAIVRSGEKLAEAIPKQPDGKAFFVLDSRLGRKFSEWPNFISTAPGIAYAYLDDYKNNRKDIFFQADSIEELAKKIGVPAINLADTIRDHNDAIAQQVGGNPSGNSITEPPFIALGPAKSWIVITDGGLAVSERMEVLNAAGSVMPGLFAAGSNGQGGALLEGHGTHVGWAIVSGRIAGKSATLSQPLASRSESKNYDSHR